MRIRWSRRARVDLRNIRESIAKDSSSDAKQFVEKIIIATEKLIDHPRLGRKVPEAGQDHMSGNLFFETIESSIWSVPILSLS